MDWTHQTTGPDMTDLLTVLQQHFPGKNDIIKQWLGADPTLQEIAENYLDCVNALRYWGQSKSPESKARITEYLTVSKELEQEALEVLEARAMRSNV
jgi:hypothetical protein